MVRHQNRPPVMQGEIGFNVQHAPMGAFMSFTCGCPDAAGGIGVEIGKPAGQNIFVGVKQGDRTADTPIRCLPFFRDAGAEASAASNYDVENPNAARAMRGLETISLADIQRRYGWASNSWTLPETPGAPGAPGAPGFTFRVLTPFGSIPEPGTAWADVRAMRDALIPAVNAALEIDNTDGDETVTGVFAIDFVEPGARVLWHDEAGDRGSAFAYKRSMGMSGRLADGEPGETPMIFQQWAVADGLQSADPVHGLGTCGGFCFEVGPGQKRTLILGLGVYLEGTVTTGIEGRYLYTRYFAGLEDVLETSLVQFDDRQRLADELDQSLMSSGLSDDQQFQLAHATRGYYGSTQLLDVAGEPMWVVNEGEYCMMNTLDLSIDHVFWELKHNPWVVRNLLDQFSARYSYHDRVKDRDGRSRAGGVSFTHDMGAYNHFSPTGYSSYERAELTGCFSYMTQEQLCNWVLMAGCYVAATGDEDWLQKHKELLAACAWSMYHRADADAGVMAFDSGRCGSGSEITTYDSLDESLGQARANTYLAVKCWATWLALEVLGAARGEGDEQTGHSSGRCVSLADKIADYLCGCVKPDGSLPAVIERDNPGYDSRILPVVEALVYPDYLARKLLQRKDRPKARERLEAAMRHPLIGVLGKHALTLLDDPERRNIFEDGGLRLSSSSGNSWMSKIAICQFTIRHVLKLTAGNEAVQQIMHDADHAQARWQTCGSAYWASSDQFIHGVAKGSRYYPRLVTTVLWLDEEPAPEAPAHPVYDRSPEAVVSGAGLSGK